MVEHWTARELIQAVEHKRRVYWRNKSYELAWIVNSMPNLSKRRRAAIHPHRINPYRRREQRRGIALNTANPAAEAALDAWAERAERTRR